MKSISAVAPPIDDHASNHANAGLAGRAVQDRRHLSRASRVIGSTSKSSFTRVDGSYQSSVCVALRKDPGWLLAALRHRWRRL